MVRVINKQVYINPVSLRKTRGKEKAKEIS